MSYTYQSYLGLARSDLDEPLEQAHSAFYHLLLSMFPKKISYGKSDALKRHRNRECNKTINLLQVAISINPLNSVALRIIPLNADTINPINGRKMTHIVTESCIKCRYTDCVDVCPVDCFRAGPNFLVIDPDECIDCAVCIPECPVDAIYAEEDVPEDQKDFIDLNAELSKEWPSITRAEEKADDADEWADIDDKRNLLEK